jgi:glyoxylase-like metal-dependent hydrolase (beta-lactamase superfamily II)
MSRTSLLLRLVTMKKIIKRTLGVLGVLLLIPVLGFAVLFATREPPDGPRVQAGPGIVGVEAGGAYAWIVRTPHGAVLIDAGLDASGAAILGELAAEHVAPSEVQAVLLTHGHPDHYAAAPRFERATVIVGADDVAMVRGDTSHYAPFGLIMGALLPLPPAPGTLTGIHGGEPLVFDGATFTTVAMPGHTPGSLAYLHARTLFTGDSLMRKGDGVTTVSWLFSEDAARNRAAARGLAGLDFDTIADGHAGVVRDAKAKLRRFLAGS